LRATRPLGWTGPAPARHYSCQPLDPSGALARLLCRWRCTPGTAERSRRCGPTAVITVLTAASSTRRGSQRLPDNPSLSKQLAPTATLTQRTYQRRAAASTVTFAMRATLEPLTRPPGLPLRFPLDPAAPGGARPLRRPQPGTAVSGDDPRLLQRTAPSYYGWTAPILRQGTAAGKRLPGPPSPVQLTSHDGGLSTAGPINGAARPTVI